MDEGIPIIMPTGLESTWPLISRPSDCADSTIEQLLFPKIGLVVEVQQREGPFGLSFFADFSQD